MTTTLLELKDLITSFKTSSGLLPAVDGLSFKINIKETLALVGESGCGKSMTTLSIMRLLPENGLVTNGQILFNGSNLCDKTENEMTDIRGDEISMIFQEPMTSLNPVLTIGDQITEGILTHNKISKKEANLRAEEMLKLVGISRADQILHDYPHQLSGGMRQRVMIAMAMAMNPKLLIADEPTTALDVTTQAQILELMKNIKESSDTSILLITHDLGVVSEMADKVIVMYSGQVMEEAGVVELFDKPSHPYTQGLMKSIPDMESEVTRLYSIPGNVPSSDNLPDGCRFAPRCNKAWEDCFKEVPKLYKIESGHKVRCFLYKGVEQ